MDSIYNLIATINFDPVAINLGPIKITWYALSYITGLLFSWRYALYLGKSKYSVNSEVIDSFFNNAILGVIIGGRLGYVVLYNFDYYSENLIEVLYIWQGGMSFHGGLVGVIIAQIVTSIKYKIKFFIITDISSLTVPFGFMLGRIANFINGELVGKTTDVFWGVIFPNVDNNIRHPSQLYEAFFEGIVLFIIMNSILFRNNYKTGTCSYMFLIFYGIFRSISEFFREPDLQVGYLFNQISMGMMLSFLMILAGIIIFLKKDDIK